MYAKIPQEAAVITRRLLRDEVQAEIVARIFSGQFVPEVKINELELAGELGVSRTPVREALGMLAQEGVLRSLPGRGFVLPALTPAVVREVYPLIAALEAVALRNADPAELAALVPSLNAICTRMLVAKSGVQIQELDDEWHALLCSRYENERLRSTVATFKTQVRRYELTLFADPKSVQASVREHRAIARAVQRADVDSAAALLQVNWHAGMQRLLTWMSAPAR